MTDSWVVSQIWLDSDSNESSQSRVGRENEGYESSQSRVTQIVIWVRVESTGYCLSQSWVSDFSRRKRQDLAIICNLTEKEPTYSYIRPHPSPPPSQQCFPKLGKMWWVVSQVWLNSDLSQSWVWLVNLEFELSRSVMLANLGFEFSRSWVIWAQSYQDGDVATSPPCPHSTSPWPHFIGRVGTDVGGARCPSGGLWAASADGPGEVVTKAMHYGSGTWISTT